MTSSRTAPAPAGRGSTDGDERETTLVIDRSWWSWAGAHGGLVAGLVLDAMRRPLAGSGLAVHALHAHFLRPIDESPLTLRCHVEHRGRTTATTAARATQDGRTALLATAVHGAGDEGPRWPGRTAPPVPAPEDCDPLPLPLELVPFARHVEIRPATGDLPLGGGPRPELTAWVRFADGRTVDAPGAITLLDSLPPALYAIATVPLAVPTVELAVHLAPDLRAGPVDDWVLTRIATDHAGDGWTVDDATLHTRSGALLATGRQTRKVIGGHRPATGQPAP